MNAVNIKKILLLHLNLGESLNSVEISLGDVPEAFLSVLESTVSAVLLYDRLDLTQSVERDSWEYMMLDLVLHASAHVVQQPGLEVDVSGGHDLVSNVVVDLVLGFCGFTSDELLLRL